MTNMTELPRPSQPEHKETDSDELRQLLRSMQAVVDDHMQRIGKPANLLTPDEIIDFSQRVSKYVAFVSSESNLIGNGTEIAFTGAGGFLFADQDREIVGGQRMDDSDTIAGKIESCVVTLVPTVNAMLEDTDGEGISLADYSMSATLVLNFGIFRAELQSDGTHDVEADLANHLAIVPLIYDMTPRALAAESL